jgi:hypothetical protein
MDKLLESILYLYFIIMFLISIFVGCIIFNLDSDIVYDKNSMCFMVIPTNNKKNNNISRYIYKLMCGIYMGIITCFIFAPLLIISCLPIIIANYINS